ncbi:MAG: hypothetical protein HQL31_02340 [Planctomycetes bacterium]|nr:hypothetical protein [Planctomycetota bacterium]
MSHFKLFVLITGAALLLLPARLMAEDAHMSHGKTEKEKSESVAGTQKLCPIMGGKVNPKVFVEHRGQKVYFCCPGCSGKFLEDPEAHFEKMAERGETAENVQTHCPVTGEALESRDVSVTLPGRRVYFCCKMCVNKFKNDKESYLKKMDKAKDEKAKMPKGQEHSAHH